MTELKEAIKDFMHDQGVEVVGCAGPERLDGPPSMDPTYSMKGAKSIICFALPMDVPAIEDFLSKKSPTPHNLDQLRKNQEVHRIAKRLETFIHSQGHRALASPPNSVYRRSLDVFKTYPNFSHRFGAIASGIAGQALSGNVMTEKWGASVYLNTVFTDAVLESDTAFAPRHFMENYCQKCNICYQACPAGMFDGVKNEEQVLLNGELHPRGNRHSIDLCNMSCFGLHGLSKDKKWSSWGRHLAKEWMDGAPQPDNFLATRVQLMNKGGTVGDSTARFDQIRQGAKNLWPKELLDAIPDAKDLPEDKTEADSIILKGIEKLYGNTIKVADANSLTCGQCALVCGPEPKESMRRFRLLNEGGIVVPGPDGNMVNAKTFEEAQEIRRKYPQRVPRKQRRADALASAWMWHRDYFGIEPKSILQGLIYKIKLKLALRRKKLPTPQLRLEETLKSEA